ncbi:MAG: hypothetical protein GC181_16430 [Bacteroidetes bacterium]|nr:hypothetical protein [Bacteroidota bacterium]
MKSLVKNPRTVAITFTVLLIAAILGTATMYKKSNRGLMSSLNDEKLKTEELLSEKLKLEKEIAMMQEDLLHIKGDRAQLTEALEKQKAINASRKNTTVNTGASKIKSLKKEIEDLIKQKNTLSNELAEAKKRLKEMEGDNADLRKEIASLNATNKRLNDDLAMIQGINADQFNLVAYKGKNEKITVKAKKVNKIETRFKVPSYVAANAGFKIKTPDGQIIDKTSKGMSMTITDDIPETYASVDGVQPTEVMKEIELTYTPEKKLKAGQYRVELYNGGNYLTSCIITLK